MTINKGKTKTMIFNMTRMFQFPPEISLAEPEFLEVVDEAKILGVIISNDLKWTKNTDYIVQKALKNIWVIRRMKNLGFDDHTLKDIYLKEIRSVLEFAVPVWTGALTQKDSDRIENIQKRVFKLILQNKYSNYENACETLKCDTLKDRRLKLCLNFSRKEYKKENSMFNKLYPTIKTRQSNKKIVKEFSCLTDRFFRSSLPFLSRMLNENHANNK